MNFSPEYLYRQLQVQPAPAGWQVAFSGGLDSSVLLHALAGLGECLAVPLGAVHVHHGLQPAADEWERHCRAVCERLGVGFSALHVDARASNGDSPEAAARAARYTALAAWLPAGQVLLTAQHRDDQAETLLLQLLRGAGVQGLAAMPAQAAFGQGRLLRPLLAVSRAALQRYARSLDLDWIEDPSNRDTGLDRNFLRHAVMPLLESRWPAAAAGLCRSAANAAEATTLLHEVARGDSGRAAGAQPGTLSIAALASLSEPRRRNLLRAWMKQQGGSAPSSVILERVIREVLGCRADADPGVTWAGHTVRRYRDTLYVLPQPHRTAGLPERDWQPPRPLAIPCTGRVLSASPVTGTGLRAQAIGPGGVRVRWRRGGERCRPAGRAHHHALKKLFQEAGVPPWERARIPLLYIDDVLAAVGDLWVCEPFQAGAGEAGYRIHWQPGQAPHGTRPD